MQQTLMFKLDQSPKGLGLRCDDEGLFLGCEALLRRDQTGKFLPKSSADLQKTFSGVYGDEVDWESRIRSVGLVANALNKGELARAMMAAVLMRLPDPAGLVRIVDVDGTLGKANFNPDEARDEFELAAALTRNARERELLLERAGIPRAPRPAAPHT